MVVVTPLAAPRYPVADLTRFDALVTAGYCSASDLQNQINSAKGWTYSSTTRKFSPQH